MPELTEEGKQKINPWLREQLERQNSPDTYNLLLEIEPGGFGALQSELSEFTGITLDSRDPIVGRYVPATVPNELVDEVARLPAVKEVHYDMPVSIENNLPGFQNFSALRGNIDQALTDVAFDLAPYEDPILGKVRISDVVVPRINIEQLGDPLQAIMTAADQYTGSNVSGNKIIPTGKTVDWMLNAPALEPYDGEGVKAGVIDTGFTPVEPANRLRFPVVRSHVPGEPGLDLMSHGSFCQYTLGGGSAPSTWGRCAGVAPGVDYAHFKALNTFPGFGMTSWILRAMEDAVDWGADVISMSLGGTQQGPVGDDPQVQAIQDLSKKNRGDDGAIFVVASGNSGPGRWTIGSPGVAPNAITVGAWSMTDQAPASFSSRGPSGEWYGNNQGEFQSDKREYGSDLLVKPDVVAPGGGRSYSDRTPMELLHQTETGWAEGMYDGIKDTRGAMKGSSQATPHFAGLVAILYEAGIVTNSDDVKALLKQGGWSPQYDDAPPSSFDTEDGKNIACGWGPGRASRFTGRGAADENGAESQNTTETRAAGQRR